MSSLTKQSSLTPLQQLLGFEASEADYDLLDFREQIILDLMISGWSQEDVGILLGLSQGWISIIFRQIRFKMAESNLKRSLEIRLYYKENHPLVGLDTLDDVNAEE